MAVIKVTDIAYVRLRSPDLDLQAEFLDNFGLVPERTKATRRSTTAAPIRCITSTSPRRAIRSSSASPITPPARTISRPSPRRPAPSGIENLDEPGGGKRVRLTEPNGYQIEVVWGMDKVNPIEAPRQLLNSGYAPLARKGEMMRIQKGPSRREARRPRRARHAEGRRRR